MHQDATWYGCRLQPRRLCCMGTQLPLLERGWSPQFLAHVYCGQTAGWDKMPLGTEVDLGPGNIVLNEDPAPSPEKRGHSPPPIFGLCLLWLNGCVYQHTKWYGVRPQPTRHCVTCGPHSLSPKGAQPPNCRSLSLRQFPPLFGPCLLWPRSPISATAEL